jgi:hypothetical protein
MSKYGQLIKEARNTENQKTRKPSTEKGRDSDPEVNLSIKVAASRRRHWAAEAKRKGITLTAVIIEALSRKFGEPE